MLAGVRLPRRMFITADAVGGVWQYTLDLASGLAARGIETVLAVLGPEPGPEQRQAASVITGLDLHLTRLPLDWTAEGPGALANASECLAGLAGRLGADAVHLHSPALVGQATWPAPVIAVAHSCVATWWRAVRSGPLPADFAWRATAISEGLYSADAVIAPSQAHAQSLGAAYGFGAAHVVHNGRMPLCHHRQSNRAVLAAGRLWDDGKNIALLDLAARDLNGPVIGAGPLHGPNGAITSLKNIQALGPLNASDMPAAYARACIFASPALYEPFGLAVLEAAQAGLALVLSDIPSFRELWHGAAILIDPGDAAAWRTQLQILLDDADLCRVMGHRAKQRAQRYTVAAMVKQTLAVHRSARVSMAAD
ncbi:MAG: glycosyltransferase family 4 protein [Acetobacteraceae bacterium]|nr:glycosyltransferase family 4 protein [Acetobacteraceae bacterium]